MEKNFTTDGTKTVKAAENTHSNEGTTNNQNNENNRTNQALETKKTSKKRYKPTPLGVVLRDARTIFRRQITKNGEVKKEALKEALAKNAKLYPDKLRFELDFKAERDRLLDSKRFIKDCERESKTPKYMADNILFEGKSFVDRVLKNGIDYEIGEKMNMFNCPLWEDSENLYDKEVDHE